MSIRRIIHELSLSKPSHVSNRNIYSHVRGVLGRRSLSSTSTTVKVKPECTTNTRCLVSNPPYPIPRSRDDDLSSIHDPPQRPEVNHYYGEKYLNSTVRFLIHNLSDLDTARKYARLTTFTETRGPITTSTCDLIISAMCEAKRYQDAYDLFHYFFNVINIKLDASCCNHIVKALCHDGRAHDALQLHHHIRNNINAASLTLEFQTYRIMTKCLYNDGMIEEALDLVKDLFSFRLADPEDYDIAVSRFLDDEKNFEHSWALCCAVYFNIIDGGNKSYPTVTKVAVTVSMIEFAFGRGDADRAMSIYNCLLDNVGGAIENASKKPLFEVLYKYGKVKEAWSLFHLMLRVPFILDEDSDNSESINAVINELFKLGMTNEAVDAFVKVGCKQNMFSNNFRYVPYSNFITRCLEDESLFPKAESVFRELVEKNPSACKISTFEEMINAYVKAGRLDDAVDAANKMVDAHLRQVSSLLKS